MGTLLLFTLLALAQDPDPPGAELEVLAKHRAYLERNPFHATGFDRLVHEAVERDLLARLEEDYAGRVAERPEELESRVVLARLQARARRPREALATLAPLRVDELESEGAGAPLLALRGELQLGLGEFAQAVASLEAAAAAADDRLLLEEIHALCGRAWMRAGRPAAAAVALGRLAELDPESYALRLEAAALMAGHGLVDAAVVQLESAVELAAGDVSRRCRALVEIGRLNEDRGRAAEAARAYAAASEWMGPGHWQRAELFERRLELHRGLGTVGELVAAAREEVAALPGDLEAQRFLARALEEDGRAAEARACSRRPAPASPPRSPSDASWSSSWSRKGRASARSRSSSA